MRTVHAQFQMTVEAEADFILLTLPAAGYDSRETLALTLDGEAIEHVEVVGRHGTREIRFVAGPGELACTVDAEVHGRAEPATDPDPARYLANSRYVEVSELRDFASERFGNASGWDAVDAITRWVASTFTYDMYMSEVDDSAVTSVRKQGGMCRDFAHVTIGLCRALDIPARYVSVYAPELQPPDFHAVAEVFLDDDWWLVDATRLAPRSSMIRISTGIDAEEAAWATNLRSRVELGFLTVRAEDSGEVQPEDPSARVRLA